MSKPGILRRIAGIVRVGTANLSPTDPGAAAIRTSSASSPPPAPSNAPPSPPEPTPADFTLEHTPLGVSNLSGWEALIENQIKSAQRRGLFRNLEGHGKPMQNTLEAPLGVDNLEWQVNKILAAQGYKPGWVELLGGIHRDMEEAGKKLTDSSVSDQERRSLVAAINRKIQYFNVSAPEKVKRMPLFQPELQSARD